MLSFISNLFRTADNRTMSETIGADAPQNGIQFKPHLVNELQRDHRELVRLFQALVVAHREGDFDASVDCLKRFTYTLRAHLLKENLHLYVYLKHALQHDTESADLMAGMRTEMGRIGRTLNEFVTRYTTSPWDSNARESLLGELDQIGQVLMHRIHQEEEVLYPMYMPLERYK